MRTMITIVSLLLMICTAIPERVNAQAKATAAITATVIPSISLELKEQNTIVTKGNSSLITMNLRGTENILVTVESKEARSASVLQLTNEKPATIDLPSSSQARKTSITYLSS